MDNEVIFNSSERSVNVSSLLNMNRVNPFEKPQIKDTSIQPRVEPNIPTINRSGLSSPPDLKENGKESEGQPCFSPKSFDSNKPSSDDEEETGFFLKSDIAKSLQAPKQEEKKSEFIAKKDQVKSTPISKDPRRRMKMKK